MDDDNDDERLSVNDDNDDKRLGVNDDCNYNYENHNCD